MCGGWLGPLLIFWLQVWGPLRPFGAAGPPSPAPAPYALALAACVAAWWAPASYFRTRAWEADGAVYQALGVRAFRGLVPDGDVVNRRRRRRNPDFRVIADRGAAAAFVRRTVDSERAHGVLLLAGVVTSAYAWQIGWRGWAVFLGTGNLLVNLYPMLLQRYTRARLHRLLARPGTGRGIHIE
jgi:Glycosyl-4,4'-diaponeurosporenoate acyltransferase